MQNFVADRQKQVEEAFETNNHLPIEPRPGDLVEPLLEHHLVIIHVGELEQDPRSCLGEGEAAFELHFFTNGRGFFHAQAMRGSEKECSLRKEMFGVRYIGLALSSLHEGVDLFLPHVAVGHLRISQFG